MLTGVKIVHIPYKCGTPAMTDLGLDAVGGSPGEFAAFIRQDIAKYAKIVKVAAIPLQ